MLFAAFISICAFATIVFASIVGVLLYNDMIGQWHLFSRGRKAVELAILLIFPAMIVTGLHSLAALFF